MSRSRSETPNRGRDAVACSLSIVILIAIGLIFTLVDLIGGISTIAPAVLIVLALGLLVSWPLIFGGRRSVRGLLFAIAIYGVFAAWIVTLDRVDWNVAKPFTRAFHQIHPGMTQAEIEAVVRREFAGKKPPVARWEPQRGLYILDPDSGAYNAEIIEIRMANGCVLSAEYLPD